ncbi:histidine phosphatase family protein [Nocardioides sp. KIGAM211]|uniref:Histidine phosphatase family protein n=1 Tax=Nocardioides luti TaxID=2761101 RepID=A0A7X0RK20_9ACTN|nr:histidine phosphatase family protein [Nocardioides luti]
MLTSDIIRAQQAAAIIGTTLRLEPETDPLSCECHYGTWQGSDSAEAIWDDTLRHPLTARCGHLRQPHPRGGRVTSPGERLGHSADAQSVDKCTDADQLVEPVAGGSRLKNRVPDGALQVAVVTLRVDATRAQQAQALVVQLRVRAGRAQMATRRSTE